MINDLSASCERGWLTRCLSSDYRDVATVHLARIKARIPPPLSVKVNKNADATSIIPLSSNIFILFPVRKNVQQRCTGIVKRKTHFVVNNVMDTRSEHSVQPFRSNSILGLAFLCAKRNDYPQPSPHQPMRMYYWRSIKVWHQNNRLLERRGSFQSPIEIINILFGRHVPNRTHTHPLLRESSIAIRDSPLENL